MLLSAHPLTDDLAARWARAGVPHWVSRWLLVAGWAAALACALLAVDGDDACSAADPSVCGPDLVSAGFTAVLLATPVLLLWLPPVGCLAGVVFAAGELLFDDHPTPRLAFGLHGTACLLVGLWLLAAVGRQRAVAAELSGGLTAPVPAEVGRRPGWIELRLLAAGVSALLGGALIGWYGHLADAEQQHLDRAVRHELPIVGNDHEQHVTVRIPADGRLDRDLGIDVADAGAHPDAGTVPVLLDPNDREWLRLVAEPLDETLYAGAGIAALLLALLLLAREVDRRVALRRLPGNRPAVRVRIVPDAEGDPLVLPAGGPDVPVARLRVDQPWPGGVRPDPAATPAYPEDDEEDRAWRGEPTPEPGFFGRGPAPVEALLIGDLRDRGWALLQTADGLLLPLWPLAVRRWALTGEPGVKAQLSRLPLAGAFERYDQAQVADDDGLPGLPVAASDRTGIRLPQVAGPSAGTRRLGLLAAAAGLIGAAVAIARIREEGLHQIAFVLALMTLAEWGAKRALLRFDLTADRLVISGATRTVEVPWGQLIGVRRDEEHLFLNIRGLDEPGKYGPFAAAPGGTEEQAAQELAETLMALRERDAPQDAPPIRTRRRPLWWVLALYGLASAAVLLWTWLR